MRNANDSMLLKIADITLAAIKKYLTTYRSHKIPEKDFVEAAKECMENPYLWTKENIKAYSDALKRNKLLKEARELNRAYSRLRQIVEGS